MITHQKLSIHDVRLPVILGFYAEERQATQLVRFDIDIIFSDNAAARSDRLEETVCYATVVAHLKSFLHNQSYQLIEHLCYDCFVELKKIISHVLTVTVTKEKIPVSEIHGGASYTCSDKGSSYA